MSGRRFYDFIHRQILVMILLSLLPGLGYLFLGWLNHVFTSAFVWYLLVVAVSIWSARLYRGYDFQTMSSAAASTDTGSAAPSSMRSSCCGC